MDIPIILSYLLLGGIAGLIGGLVGMGGGIIIVPALYYLFLANQMPASIVMKLAICTSLSTIIITACSATWIHHRQGAISWSAVKCFTPGIMLGAILGALITDYLSSDILRTGFGLFELLVALQIALGTKPAPQYHLPKKTGMFSAGTGIGTLSTLLGIGGGSLTTPFLLWCNVSIKKAIPISTACGLPIAIFGSLALVVVGWDHPGLPEHTLGYLYWPAAISISLATMCSAPLGAKLTHIISTRYLRMILAVILTLVGLRMLIF